MAKIKFEKPSEKSSITRNAIKQLILKSKSILDRLDKVESQIDKTIQILKRKRGRATEVDPKNHNPNLRKSPVRILSQPPLQLSSVLCLKNKDETVENISTIQHRPRSMSLPDVKKADLANNIETGAETESDMSKLLQRLKTAKIARDNGQLFSPIAPSNEKKILVSVDKLDENELGDVNSSLEENAETNEFRQADNSSKSKGHLKPGKIDAIVKVKVTFQWIQQKNQIMKLNKFSTNYLTN